MRGTGSEGPPDHLQGAQLFGVLSFLNDDVRLSDILGDPPLRALIVSAADGALRIDIAPSVSISEADRKVVEDAVADAFSRAADDARHAPRVGRQGPHPPGDPDPRPHLLAARAHLDSGNPGRALEVIDAVLPRWPDNVDLHTYRALSLSALGHAEESVDAYRQVIRLDPGSVFAHAGAAQLLARLGQWEQALAYANSGLALTPEDPVLWHVLALANEHLGLYEEAAHALKQALELDPNLPNGAEDLRRIKLALEQDVEVSLLEDVPPPAPEELEDVDVELVTAEQTPPEQPSEPQPPGLPPQEAVTRGDARWGVAARHAPPAEGKRCDKCGTTNPPRVTFCVECGNRLDS